MSGSGTFHLKREEILSWSSPLAHWCTPSKAAMEGGQGHRTAVVLLLTIVGAVLIGSFVASQWAHLPALPTAGGGEVGEITTAYKTYTQVTAGIC